MTILVTFSDPAKTGSEGRLGPPESVRIPEKPAFDRKSRLLAVSKGYKGVGHGVLGSSFEAIVVYLARLEQARGGHLAPPKIRTGGSSAIGQGLKALPSTGEALPPQTPPNRQEALKGFLPPLGVGGAWRFPALVETAVPGCSPPCQGKEAAPGALLFLDWKPWHLSVGSGG